MIKSPFEPFKHSHNIINTLSCSVNQHFYCFQKTYLLIVKKVKKQKQYLHG